MLRALNLTLWSGLVVDAGDGDDLETEADLAELLAAHVPAYGIDDLAKLRDAFFELTLGAATGSPVFALDAAAVSVDGSNFRQFQRLSETYSAAGIYQIPITEPIGDDAALMRLDVTPALLDGSNYFAASSLKLVGNLWIA